MVGRGAKPSGPKALARAIRHRRWRHLHARRSRPGVSDRRQPGRGEKKREPERVHPSSVPATRRAMKATSASFSKMLTSRLGTATLVATLATCSQHDRRTRGGRSGDSTGGARPGRGHLSGPGFSFSSQVPDLRPALGREPAGEVGRNQIAAAAPACGCLGQSLSLSHRLAAFIRECFHGRS
jgi:hypothetical protein